MPFNIKKIQAKDGVLLYTLVREWEHEGHDVGLFILEHPKYPDLDKSSGPMCECDFDIKEKVDENGRKSRVRMRDSRTCPHMAAFRELCKQEAREKHGDAWREMGVKEAILDIHTRVEAGEYLGTYDGGMIYLETVGKLLNVPIPWNEADELFKEERLQLNGAILCDYQKHFRFPRELETLICLMIEAPLGGPNGEAGDGFLGRLYQLIEENTGTTHGRELFGDDYPYVRPERLLVMGLALLRVAIERAEGSHAARKGLHFTALDKCAEELEITVKKLCELEEATEDLESDTRSLKPHYLAHLMLSDSTLDTTRFRFPCEIRYTISYLMHGNGIDWSAAERSMLELEQAIAMYGEWESGSEAFWKHNYPHLSAGETVHFGLSWLLSAVKSAEDDPGVRDRIGHDLLQVALDDCHKLTSRYAKMHTRLRTWQILARKRNDVRWRVSIWTGSARSKLRRLKDRVTKKFRKGRK